MHKSMGTAVLVLAFWGSVLSVGETVHVDPEIQYQIFEGFGEGTMDQFTEHYYW